MNNREQGIILLMTLCTISVISLLLITCLQHVLLYSKAINRQELYHQSFYQLEHVALQLADKQEPACTVAADEANHIITRLMHHEGCIVRHKHANYRYLVEDLGIFSCLVLQKNNEKQATHHFRITVFLEPNEQIANDTVVQIRIINPALLSTCLGEESIVRQGVSSWRYFSDYSNTN